MIDQSNSLMLSLGGFFKALGRILTFRARRDEFFFEDRRFLYFGLLTTWMVGIGRFWDNPSVPFYRHFGVGSVLYVPILAFLLFVVILPFKPEAWTYRRVATFVAMTAPPGFLYAIPIQMLWGLESANSWHFVFLGIVSTWRVALLFFYLGRFAALGWLMQLVCSLLPLSMIISTLTVLNLDRVVFDLMDGVELRTANDSSYVVLFALTTLSVVILLPLLLAYFIGVRVAYKKQRASQQ